MFPRSAALCSLLSVSVLVLAGCSTGAADEDAPDDGATVTVDAANGEIEVPATPETVVVFDNSQLDILDALEVEVAGIPSADTVPEFFADYAEDDSVADVGSLFEPDFEAVSELDPDLIISGGRSSGATEELSEIATTIDMSLGTDTVTSLTDRTRTYGEIFDRSERAKELTTELEDRVAEVGEGVADSGDGLLVMSSSGEISAYGPGSRFGFFYDDLGLEPSMGISSDESSHGEVLSFEALADADPDWLYVIDRDTAIGEEGASPAEQVLDNELVNGTTAAEEDQILYLDSQELYLVGGIQAHLNALGQVEDALS
ncbi:iron complex transport system substrate-binding protein [Haloactinospora alba]|uniref:Iron complex transport system substrate-binding protein n=1 Tax=Haloactinospora alba TaxID=405555 RepID=A0A543NFF7_9ACTN|nr:siderophore ABC transporter substrate-binding protein [Haloactinospora alba]TQN30546.1 iron complex transport system substrate-binding protein [Haloactinospora alba]